MRYIQWTLTNYSGEKPINLGGLLSGNIFGCVKAESGNISDVQTYRVNMKKLSDDCIMLLH